MKRQCFKEADPILCRLSIAFLCPEFEEVKSHPCKLAQCLGEYLKLSWTLSWLVYHESDQVFSDSSSDYGWLFQAWHLVRYAACLSVKGPPIDACQESCFNLLTLVNSRATTAASWNPQFFCWFESLRCRSPNLVDGFAVPFWLLVIWSMCDPLDLWIKAYIISDKVVNK